MNWIPYSFRRRKLFDNLSEEMRLHLEERVDHLIGEGLSPIEAQRQARIAFGNLAMLEERSREIWVWPTLESMWADIRLAARQLAKFPGFAVTAVLTLAMAIGANAVVFGVMNGLILRSLNVPESQNLYSIERAGDSDTSQSYPDYLDIRERNRSFVDLAAYAISQVGLDAGHGPVTTWGLESTGNYFDSLGIRPYLGRFFHASDEHGPNSAPFMVLGYAYWHSQFQDDRGVIGRVVLVNKHPFTIIGVAPPTFRGTLVFYSPNFFVPEVNKEQVEGVNDLSDRGSRGLLQVLGHLKPGVTRAQAVADLDSIGTWLVRTYPHSERPVSFDLGRPSLLGKEISRSVKAFVAGLMLLATLILLAACANLGGLFAARVADRSRELALRLALGSKRTRILLSLFTEALLISLLGGAAGVSGSVALLRWLSDWQPFGNFPMHTPVTPNASVYSVALLVTLLSGCLFGAVPIAQVLRTSPYEVVKAGLSAKTLKRFSARDVLLVVQISLCAVLVTSSLVAVRGLIRSLHGPFGFDPNHSMLVDLRMVGLSRDPESPIQRRMLDAVEAIPGVDSAALTDALLLSDNNATNVFTDATTDLSASHVAAAPYTFRVSPGYLRTEGTVLLAGRGFTKSDDKNSPRVAIVNREFARKLFGSEIAASGRHFKMPDGTRVEVVGIAEDGKYSSLTEDPYPSMFLPLTQWPVGPQWMVIRSGRDPQQLGEEIRRALLQVDAGIPVEVEKRSDELVTVLFGPEMATIALGVLGGIGAILSITGIFGMAAYSVSKRLKELGIRVALGAQRKEVLRAALGRAVKQLVIGSAVGLGLGILATRVLAFIVYQATPRDPLVLAGVVVAMAFLGLVATWIPAQRALSVNPLVLLREE
jgi:predicted permease